MIALVGLWVGGIWLRGGCLRSVAGLAGFNVLGSSGVGVVGLRRG